MILEGIVTTLNPDGTLNVAPMGPKVGPTLDRFVLRPFRTSTTYRNLAARGEGVLHVIDDVLLLARAAIGQPVDPPTRPARVVDGRILADACRYIEFRVTALDDRDDRATIEAVAVASGHLRDHFGFNRAKHAVVEAAILATRTEILDIREVSADFRRLRPLIEKTGGDAEHAAFALLSEHVRDAARARGIDPDA